MALKGNLRDFTLYQLLNLINLARKTGELALKAPDRTAVHLFFQGGKLIDAAVEGRDPTLAHVLLRTGKITEEQAQAVRQRASVNTDKELGLLLIHSGFLSQPDIVAGVRAYLLETIYSLFTWPEGDFLFTPNQLPPAERITVPLPLDNVIIEGSRRMQETTRLREELPDLNVPLKFIEKPSTSLRNINLSVEEWKVISFINSRNTIRQIADYLRIDEVKMRRLVFGLQAAGLVTVGMPNVNLPPPGRGFAPSLVRPAQPPAAPAPAARFTRNVLMRIIDGIRRR